MKIIKRLLILGVAASLSLAAAAADISGAGATFPYPIYAKWADAYKKLTGRRPQLPIHRIGRRHQADQGEDRDLRCVRYAFEAGRSEGFRTDSVPHDHRRRRAGGEHQGDSARASCIWTAQRLPAFIWATSPSGTIRRSRSSIRSLTLPSTAIAPVYRSDGSGTNFLFSDYLSKSSPKFQSSIGANTSVQWPVGIGAKGNEGVANMTTQTDGAIGYVEYAYAKQNKMAYTLLTNKAGNAVAPSAESFQAAAATADWAGADSYYLILTDQPGAKSWPITGASFILVYKQPDDAAAVKEALKFFAWAYKDGAGMAAELDYVPLPAALIAQVKKTWGTANYIGRPPGMDRQLIATSRIS